MEAREKQLNKKRDEFKKKKKKSVMRRKRNKKMLTSKKTKKTFCPMIRNILFSSLSSSSVFISMSLFSENN
jgi:hypothetical protein